MKKYQKYYGKLVKINNIYGTIIGYKNGFFIVYLRDTDFYCEYKALKKELKLVVFVEKLIDIT
jgi:hypothetical protein